jgi:putative MFS transporter
MFVALTMAGFLVDRLGRRQLALNGLLFTFIPLLAMAALRPSEDFVIFGMFVVAQTASFFAIFSTWPYTAETYPTNVRALGVGYGSSVGRASSMLMPILVGFVLNRGAPIQIVLAIFGLFALGAFFVWLTRTRETSGVPLETA